MERDRLNRSFGGHYYLDKHYHEVIDLPGRDFFIDNSSNPEVNRPEDTGSEVDEKINFHDDCVVRRARLFLQGEYKNDQTSDFLSVAVSQKSYKRIDYFQCAPGDQKTDWQNFLAWNVKGGLNYDLVTTQNVCINVGYIKCEPTFSDVFLNYKNDINNECEICNLKILHTINFT